MQTIQLTPYQQRLERKQRAMRSRQRQKDNVAAYTVAKRDLTEAQRAKIRRRVAAHVLLCRNVPIEEIADRLKVPVRSIIEWDRLGRPLL